MSKANIGLTRRTILKSGVAAAAFGPLGMPAVHAQTKEIRLLQDQTFVDSLRVIKEAAARYEQERGVRVVVDTVPSADLYPRILAGIRGGRHQGASDPARLVARAGIPTPTPARTRQAGRSQSIIA